MLGFNYVLGQLSTDIESLPPVMYQHVGVVIYGLSESKNMLSLINQSIYFSW